MVPWEHQGEIMMEYPCLQVGASLPLESLPGCARWRTSDPGLLCASLCLLAFFLLFFLCFSLSLVCSFPSGAAQSLAGAQLPNTIEHVAAPTLQFLQEMATSYDNHPNVGMCGVGMPVLQCDDCANILCYVLFCPHLIVHDSLEHVIPSNKMVVFIIYYKNAFEITFFLIKNKVVLNTLVVPIYLNSSCLAGT